MLHTPLLPFSAGSDLDGLRKRPDVYEAVGLGERGPLGLLRVVSTPAAEGLSGGWTTGELGEASRLELPPASSYRRHTRLDPDSLFAVTLALTRDPTLRGRLIHRPTSSLYRAGGRLRYLETHLAGGLRGYHLIAVDMGELLDDLLDLAETGVTLDALAASLAEDPDVALADALELVTELADAQILVPDLTPPVTGTEPLAEVLRQLAEHPDHPSAATAHETLTRVRDALARLDAAGPGAAPETYGEITLEIGDLPGALRVPPRLHVDLVKPAAVTLGPEPLREIARALALIERLPHPTPKRALELFRDSFRERWGDGREVPLGLALDPEVGLPFGETPPPDGPRPQPLPGWLADRLDRALARGEPEIVVADEEIEPCDPPAPPLPSAFHVRVRLAAASAEAIDRGDFRLCVMGLAGPAGARLLGRLCHADPALAPHVERHLAQEAALSPDAAFAEIVHLPEGRPGVSASRPRLTEYEIVYQGKGAAGPEHRIPVSDLRLVVQGDEIQLRSARLGRRVVPRLSAAHFVGGSNQPIYRFLGALQNQGVRGGWAWSWGERQGEPFLPRVRCGRWIMTRARWRVSRAEIEALAAVPVYHRLEAAAAWRAGRRLPLFPAFDDREYELAADLGSAAGVKAFLAVAQDSLDTFGHVVLTELFPPPNRLAVRGPEGGFLSELIVPFVRRAA